jgi:RimJ/RimL family protein N-acetyltransferase
MEAFPIDRMHPPRGILYRDSERVLQIGPWALEEVDACVVAMRASLPELRAFMPFAHAPITREGQYRAFATFLADWWAGRQYVAALRGAGGEILGGVGLHPRTALNPRALEVGYWLATPHWGKGYATLAVRMMSVLAMDLFDCDRLQVSLDEANLRSRGVVERCGFVFEGVLRNIMAEPTDEMLRQGYCGTARARMYAMTPDDFRGFDWAPVVRRRTVLVDALGRERPLGQSEGNGQPDAPERGQR